MNILQYLDSIDKQVFTFIHSVIATNWLDAVMLLIRNPLVWVPLYCFMIYWAIRYQKKHAFKFIGLTIVTVAFTDFVSASVMKQFFERPRPCYSIGLQPVIRNIIGCGGLYSFPSSHASNHFGMATFWFWSIYIITGHKWRWVWLWATLICFAQVYVGKHYPFDVLAGGIFGWLAGIGSAKLFERWISVPVTGSSIEPAKNTA
ncbi:MAG TPA: phosphatase PAP2 family protein [Chitinophagaceae bacterium]|nr:phosphatase PAP2 family protein [Chitinophagaceae bacterium]